MTKTPPLSQPDIIGRATVGIAKSQPRTWRRLRCLTKNGTLTGRGGIR